MLPKADGILWLNQGNVMKVSEEKRIKSTFQYTTSSLQYESTYLDTYIVIDARIQCISS